MAPLDAWPGKPRCRYSSTAWWNIPGGNGSTRNMCLEQQLRRQPDGTFLMRFSGKELKIGRRSDGTVNELRGVLDGPLAERMEGNG